MVTERGSGKAGKHEHIDIGKHPYEHTLAFQIIDKQTNPFST